MAQCFGQAAEEVARNHAGNADVTLDDQPSVTVQVGAADRRLVRRQALRQHRNNGPGPGHLRCRPVASTGSANGSTPVGRPARRSPCVRPSTAPHGPMSPRNAAPARSPGIDLGGAAACEARHLARMRRQDRLQRQTGRPVGPAASRFSASASTTTRPCHASRSSPSGPISAAMNSRASACVVKPGPISDAS